MKKALKKINRGELGRKRRSNSSKREDRGNNNNTDNTGSQISKNPASNNYKDEEKALEYIFPKYLKNTNNTKKRH